MPEKREKKGIKSVLGKRKRRKKGKCVHCRLRYFSVPATISESESGDVSDDEVVGEGSDGEYGEGALVQDEVEEEEEEEEEGIKVLAGHSSISSRKKRKKKQKKKAATDKEKQYMMQREEVLAVVIPPLSCASPSRIYLPQANAFRNTHKIYVSGSDVPDAVSSFEQLYENYNFPSFLKRSVTAAGYLTPTPIQMQAIPLMLHVSVGQTTMSSAGR